MPRRRARRGPGAGDRVGEGQVLALIDDDHTITGFMTALSITFLSGLAMWLPVRHVRHELRIRDGFLKKLPSGKISLWEYYNVVLGLPCYFPRIIAEDLRRLKGRVERCLDASDRQATP